MSTDVDKMSINDGRYVETGRCGCDETLKVRLVLVEEYIYIERETEI